MNIRDHLVKYIKSLKFYVKYALKQQIKTYGIICQKVLFDAKSLKCLLYTD